MYNLCMCDLFPLACFPRVGLPSFALLGAAADLEPPFFIHGKAQGGCLWSIFSNRIGFKGIGRVGDPILVVVVVQDIQTPLKDGGDSSKVRQRSRRRRRRDNFHMTWNC